ncbi:MAG TPA: hypothetical protein DEP23_02410 [Ruminococcaceae bacterium]|nr:hypothetical protein [Oscillospiraceae bacterium]
MIKLFDNWYIDASDLCYQLKEKGKPDKNGNDVFSTEGYYSDIAGVLKGLRRKLLRQQIQDGNITTLDDYIKVLRAQDDLFQTMLKVLED